MTIDIDALRKHIGTKIVEEDVAAQAPLRGLAVTFDRDEQIPGQGESIPPGWHLVYFAQFSRKATLGDDGLPTIGGVLPPMPFPRRMYAGTELTFHHAVRVGDAVRRETEFTDVSLRSGGTGR